VNLNGGRQGFLPPNDAGLDEHSGSRSRGQCAWHLAAITTSQSCRVPFSGDGRRAYRTVVTVDAGIPMNPYDSCHRSATRAWVAGAELDGHIPKNPHRVFVGR